METAGRLREPAARSTLRLIEHCSAFHSKAHLDRHHVWARLEDELGDDFAHRLVDELVDNERRSSMILAG